MLAIPLDFCKENFCIVDNKLFWKSGRRKGLEAGTWQVKSNGRYRAVFVKGKNVFVHRIIYAMTHNVSEFGIIDHIDRNTENNDPANLRVVTQAVNARNTSIRVAKPLAVKFGKHEYFTRRVRMPDGTRKCIYAKTPEEANDWYLKMKQENNGVQT